MNRLAALLLLLCVPCAMGFTETTSPTSPDGTPAICDIPASQGLRNTGGVGPRGPGTGSGLCVFTSFQVMCRYHNLPLFEQFQKYMTTQEGGGWPQKLDQMVKNYCQKNSIPVPDYIQHTGAEEAFLDLAMRTRRMVCVTYWGKDNFYNGPIDHMVDLVHLDGERAAIMDNNRPNVFVWMTRAEFLVRWKGPILRNGKPRDGWAVVLLSPPPPPRPAAPPTEYGQESTHSFRWEKADWIEPGALKLFDAYTLVGVHDSKGWHPAIDNDSWHTEPSGTSPHPLPNSEAEKPKETAILTGVDSTRIHTQPGAYWRSGKQISRTEALEALTTDPFADDSGKGYVSLVSANESDRKALLSQWQTEPFREFRDKYHLLAYDPASWVVSYRKLAPGLTIQSRTSDGGKILATSPDFSPDTLLKMLRDLLPKPPAPVIPPAPPAPVIPPATPEPNPLPVPTPKPEGTSLTTLLLMLAGLYLLLRKK